MPDAAGLRPSRQARLSVPPPPRRTWRAMSPAPQGGNTGGIAYHRVARGLSPARRVSLRSSVAAAREMTDVSHFGIRADDFAAFLLDFS